MPGWRSRWRSLLDPVIVVILMLEAWALRWVNVEEPPLDFHATRQLHSAEIARGMYYEGLAEAPVWQQHLAVQQWQSKGLIEPPFMETLAVTAYRFLGGEALWVPRAFSILVWCLAGAALYGAARLAAGRVAGLLALALFLFLPYGVVASRAFMPDPLMVSLMVAACAAAFRWVGTRTPASGVRWAVVAGGLTGLAILVKAVAGFMLGPFWVALVVARHGWRSVRQPQVWLIATLALVPVLGYYWYLHLVVGPQDFSSRFFPGKWADPQFYAGWARMVDQAVGWPWLLLGLVGLVLLRDVRLGAALLGWVVGYVAYGFTLPHHMSTHDYYTLPMIPVAALGSAVVGAAAVRGLVGHRARGVAASVIVTAVLAGSATASYHTLASQDQRREAAFWAALGSRFDPSDRVIGLNANYGHPLAYYGWVDYAYWPATYDLDVMSGTFDFPTYWRSRTAGMDWFLVTDFSQLHTQLDLQAHLNANCPIVTNTATHRIYDLHPAACRRAVAQDGSGQSQYSPNPTQPVRQPTEPAGGRAAR